MKKLLIILLALALAAASAGCAANANSASGSNEPDRTKTPLAELEFSPKPINMDVGILDNLKPTEGNDKIYMADFVEIVRPADGRSEPGAVYYTVTDYNELVKLTGDLAGKTEKTVNADLLQRDFVVAVFVTVRTGGYGFEVEKAVNDGNTVTVAVKVTPPQAGSMVTQALETRCILVGFDRGDLYDDLVYEITVNGEPAKLADASAQ